MWEEISEGTLISSCLNRLDDCLSHESPNSPRSVKNNHINSDVYGVIKHYSGSNWGDYSSLSPSSEFVSNVRKGYIMNSDKRMNFKNKNIDSSNFCSDKGKLLNYRRFLNIDQVATWVSDIESPNKNTLDDKNGYKLKKDKMNLKIRDKNIDFHSNSNHFNTNYNNLNNSVKSLSENRYNIHHCNINSTSPVKSDVSTSTSTSTSNNYEQIPQFELNAFNRDKTGENSYYQASNLLNMLGPSWILCIDIAAVLLTNTDNKMALSNIGPKLSSLSRDSLTQIKQRKLSKFIREHNHLFDIRRPSPNHSALYVTLKFPLPPIMQQFLPEIIEIRKNELERNQYNIFYPSNYLSNNGINNSSKYSKSELERTLVNEYSLNRRKVNSEYESLNTSNKFIDVNNNKPNFRATQVNDQIPTVVRSFQMYECWLCVKEFANLLIRQPTQTMELREIGVLISQKARIQAKRNSSKKNYKSFLLCYPKLFRVFGKDDNHSIQWIGTYQDFVKLNSIKYQPSQTDDELFNIPTLNDSHSQFLFNLNNCSVSLK